MRHEPASIEFHRATTKPFRRESPGEPADPALGRSEHPARSCEQQNGHIALAYHERGEGAAVESRLREAALPLRAQLAPDPVNTRLIRYLARIEAALGNWK